MNDRTIQNLAPTPGHVALAEITAELVAAYVSRNSVPPNHIPALITTIHATLGSLGRPSQPEPAPSRPEPPVPIRKTVTDAHIISLEDGKPYKALKRHLGRLGLTPQSYREKWGLPINYPMVAPAYARQRSLLAKEMRLGSLRRKR